MRTMKKTKAYMRCLQRGLGNMLVAFILAAMLCVGGCRSSQSGDGGDTACLDSCVARLSSLPLLRQVQEICPECDNSAALQSAEALGRCFDNNSCAKKAVSKCRQECR